MLNGSGAAELTLRSERPLRLSVTTHDHYLKPQQTTRMSVKGQGILRVPAGGMAALRSTE